MGASNFEFGFASRSAESRALRANPGRQLAWVATLAIAAFFGACQPSVLERSRVEGDAQAALDAPGDTVPPDVVALDTQAVVDAEIVETAVPPSDGAVDGEVPAQCSESNDCAAKATPCEVAGCTNGKCSVAIKPDTAACDDGDACHTGDFCKLGKCQAGATAINCSDNNECTADSCDPKNGCQHNELATGKCGDGDPCSADDHCDMGKCVGTCACISDDQCPLQNECEGPRFCDKGATPYKCKATGKGKVCPDESPKDCLMAICDAADGQCKNSKVADGALCEDGVFCTDGDKCLGGECVFAKSVCQCVTDEKCDTIYPQNGNLCKPKYYCSKKAGYSCVVAPSSIVECDKGADTTCATNACDKKTGTCQMEPVFLINGPCDDGNSGTTGDYCDLGVCISGTNTAKCKNNADCASSEDGNVCNGTLFCNKSANGGECQLNKATIVNCPSSSDSVCLKTMCNMKTGLCESTPTERLGKLCPIGDPTCTSYIKLADDVSSISVPCDDGNVCTTGEGCKGGKCLATTNTCGCKVDSDCAGDGDKCTGTDFCNKATGKCQLNLATVVVCPTSLDTQCARNTCNALTGLCQVVPLDKPNNYVPCEDGNPCTQFDDCDDGQCVSGANTCKCSADSDCSSQEDGDSCNGTLFCNKKTGECIVNPATKVYCPSGFDTVCAKNVCNKFTGTCVVVPTSDMTLCDDGNPCSASDVCLKGECVSGVDTCTCKGNADCLGFEDGDACNGTLYCDISKAPFGCKVNPATVVNCPTGFDTDCKKNVCNKKSAVCEMLAIATAFAPCDDGNYCTANDICKNGQCQSGTNLCQCAVDTDCAKFDDTNPCNGDLYCADVDKKKMCVVNPSSVVTCVLGVECIPNVCDPTLESGKCVAKADIGLCNDNNPCTAEVCTAAGACQHNPVGNGTPCGVGKFCEIGKCAAL